jgi:hypothetical protein
MRALTWTWRGNSWTPIFLQVTFPHFYPVAIQLTRLIPTMLGRGPRHPEQNCGATTETLQHLTAGMTVHVK